MEAIAGFTLASYFIFFVVLLKILHKFITNWDRSYTCLVGKTAIVTGSNTGIGYYTALDFAKRGARVILACRDLNKAEQARKNIIKLTGNSEVIIRSVDFASLEHVRKFAKKIIETEDRLDILVNNAGVGGLNDITSRDGLNLLMQINHFGPFLLTLLLVDLLKKSAPSRILNVASIVSHISKLDRNNLNCYRSRLYNYSNSKLCNILFANELARKLKNSGVVANSLHPGNVNTQILRRMPILKRIMHIFEDIIFKNSEEGAQTSIFVAVSKDIEGVTGKYFDNCEIAWLPPMPKFAQDESLAREVWEKSEELVKLTEEERPSF